VEKSRQSLLHSDTRTLACVLRQTAANAHAREVIEEIAPVLLESIK
jgi:hypothetical protein